MFHSVLGTVPSFHDEEGNLYCAIAAFQHPDADLARDPLSTNRLLIDTAELATFGTLVVAGSSPDHIRVLIPDTVGTTVNVDSSLALQHVVGLRLGTAVDLSSSLPPPDLDRALCDNSVLPSLIRQHKAYWTEINPMIHKWQSVNETKCPECARVIPINMAHHLRPVNVSGAVLSRAARGGSPQNLIERIIWRRHTFSVRVEVAIQALRMHHCGTQRMIFHCWLRLGYPRLHIQVPSSPLWPTHRRQLIR